MLYLESFYKARKTYAQNAIVQKHMRHKLIEILHLNHRVHFGHIFEFGAGGGEFTTLLCKMLQFESYISNDIHNYGSSDERVEFMCFDMNKLLEQHIAKKSFDLIVSNATLQWLDFERTLCALKQILAPNGLCLLSSFGEQNCYEVKAITHYGLEYFSLGAMREIITKHFEILLLQEELFPLQFKSALDVFRHFQLSGVNALSKKGYMGKRILREYEQTFNNRLTYHPIYMLLCHK